jgi:cysteine desulfurase family protein (TIGR01976 family)
MKMNAADFPINWVRSRFPAVAAAEDEKPPFAYMDNAGGAQVPDTVISGAERFFIERNVNLGGPYRRCRDNMAAVDEVRERLTGFLGAAAPDEIFFSLNATTLIRLFATSIREVLKPGDEIILTSLDHEANVTAWLRLQSAGVKVHFWNPRGNEALLQLGDLKGLLSERTRLVAVCGASNLLGTINDLKAISELVHRQDAILFVDGVHSAPHKRSNIQRDGVDVFVCSGYKIFGSHIGIAACRRSLLEQLPSLNHYFLKDRLKFELGTQNFEGMAAMAGLLDYFDELAKELGILEGNPYDRLFEAIGAYERNLSERLIGGLLQIPGMHVYGLTDPAKFPQRTPTAAFTLEGRSPVEVATVLGKANIGVNFGDLYAARIVDWLGLRHSGGVVRASLVHYNTVAEIDRLLENLSAIK